MPRHSINKIGAWERAPEHPERLPVRKRAKTIRKMGNQPDIKAGEIQRIDQTEPNLRSAEPFSFPRRPEIVTERQQPYAVRRVVEAELDDLLEWGVPKFQHRWPRCSRESVLGLLRLAARGGKMYLARTDNACALFLAEVTPWEPMLSVYEVFVVSRVIVPYEVKRLYQAGRDWAKEIGACGFHFGEAMGDRAEEFEPFAKSIGYTHKTAGFTLRFDVEPPPVRRVLDGSVLAAALETV